MIVVIVAVAVVIAIVIVVIDVVVIIVVVIAVVVVIVVVVILAFISILVGPTAVVVIVVVVVDVVVVAAFHLNESRQTLAEPMQLKIKTLPKHERSPFYKKTQNISGLISSCSFYFLSLKSKVLELYFSYLPFLSFSRTKLERLFLGQQILGKFLVVSRNCDVSLCFVFD